MINKGADTSYNYFDGIEFMPFTSSESELLRGYAKKVAELASTEQNDKKRKLWYEHNALRSKTPVILCDPEHGWYEIIRSDELECTGELARKIEWVLKREIFWGESMGDDRPIESTFSVPHIYTDTGWGFQEVEAQNNTGGAYHIDILMEDYEEDMGKLKYPEIVIDWKKSDQLLEMITELLGDILEVKRATKWWWSIATKRGVSDTIAFLRGMENMMIDMIEYPDEMKQVMQFILDGSMKRLDFLEENGLLVPNNDGTYICSGGLGYSDELNPDAENTKLCDMWGFAESQMTSSVSPTMFEEFIFEYQLPMLKRFGMTGYGCCEGLDTRWDIMQRIPNLRRVSVSAWANHEKMAEQLQDKYIFSSKPSPTPLALPTLEQEEVREWARQEAMRTKNCVPEIIMKDNHTLGNNPENAINWCRIMKEEFGR